MYLLVKGKDLEIERMINKNGEVVVEIFLADYVELQANKNVKIEKNKADETIIIKLNKQNKGVS